MLRQLGELGQQDADGPQGEAQQKGQHFAPSAAAGNGAATNPNMSRTGGRISTTTESAIPAVSGPSPSLGQRWSAVGTETAGGSRFRWTKSAPLQKAPRVRSKCPPSHTE